uniref:EF-hand domain-containing protein n=2 Tax=Schistocephalus solidus TaxID=70667 RepID=A0A0X3P8T3_SCHSO
MPVFCGIGSIVLASRTPIYYACSVDLTWQSTVHSCQRCPRAALTASAATAAIATQANVEGATSRFCPAGVHMGKCEPASGLFSGSWVPTETPSAVADSERPGEAAPVESETSTKPTWVPPNLPLPSPVYSRASFSPSLPARSVSPPSVGIGKPDRVRQPTGLAHTDEGDKGLSSSKTISEKPIDGKESASSRVNEPTPKPSEPPATSVSSPKSGLQNQLEKEIYGELKTEKLPNKNIEESGKNNAATERPKLSDLELVAKTPSWESSTDAGTATAKPSVTLDTEGPTTDTGAGAVADKENRPHVTVPSTTENLPEVSTEPKLPDRAADASATAVEKIYQATEDLKSPSAKVKPTPLESHPHENVEPVVKPHFKADGTADSVASATAAREKVPSKLTDNTSVIPPFFLPPGRSRMSPADCNAELERISKAIKISLEEAAKSSEEGESKVPSMTALTFSQFGLVTKACGCPLYWKRALFLASGGQNDETPVEIEAILKTWRSVLETCSDEATRFVHLLTRAKSHYLAPDDFRPIIQDVVDTHPSLGFLQAARDFHSRYVTTVVARIFFCVNSSWSGRISLGELRRSNFLKVLASLEVEEDINHVTQYFSYEHFYVIYCKFWEIDTDHDLIITKADLLRHNNYAISERMIDRIFSGAVTRGDSFKEGTMTYSEFVWFLLAEEDKRHPRSIEYWFRCMDLDGDGLLSLYELEYFYSEQSARMEEMGIEPPTLEDCLCQCLDMVKPALIDKIRLSDLKHCSLCTIFFDTFFNLPKYLQHEQRDPFANLRDNEDGTAEMSDWDRYASDAYEMLVASENGNQESAGGIGDEDEEDDEEEPSEDDPLGTGSGARAAVTSEQPVVEAEATTVSPTTPVVEQPIQEAEKA